MYVFYCIFLKEHPVLRNLFPAKAHKHKKGQREASLALVNKQNSFLCGWDVVLIAVDLVSHCGAPPVSLLLKIREHKMFCHPPYEKTSQQAETIIFKDITEAKTQSTQTPRFIFSNYWIPSLAHQ